MKHFFCSDCFKKHSLRMLANEIGVISSKPCPRCKSINGKKLSKENLIDLMKKYFEKGSIDLSVGNHQPKYRIRETSEKIFEDLVLDNDLKQDCQMLFETTGYSVDLNYSRFTNMGIWGINSEIKSIISEQPSDENYDRLDKLLIDSISKFETVLIKTGEKIFRIKKNLKHDTNIENASEFDPKSHEKTSSDNNFFDRFSASRIPIFYGAFDISTCIFESRPEYLEELTLGTFEIMKELKLIDLENVKQSIPPDEREDISFFISRMLYKREYETNSFFSINAYRLGYDGIRYCSYFSKIRNNRYLNIALFGKPIESNWIKPISFDRITVDNIDIKYSLGPVFQKEKETQIIKDIVTASQEDCRESFQSIINEANKEEFEKLLREPHWEHFEANIHSLATIKRTYSKK